MIVAPLWLLTCYFVADKERVAELESTVKALESQLEEQEQEANVVIEKWQESCAAAEERCSNLEQELDALKAKDHPEGMEGTQNTDTPLNEGAEVTSQTALDFFGQPDRRDIAELEARLREKEAALQEAQESLARDEDVVSQWEGRCNNFVMVASIFLPPLCHLCRNVSCTQRSRCRA